MSKIKEAYNEWANTYDSVENKTRDLDKVALSTMLSSIEFKKVLELGCGTGKNTEWLLQKAVKVIAVDFSNEMLAKARAKIDTGNVTFLQHDITLPWEFNETFDLLTCNLILEHVKDLQHVFQKASTVLNNDGYFFISELHPYKQYNGTKARFEKDSELILLDCFTHHASDYFNAAIENGFICTAFKEWFDEDNGNEQPRLITFIFQKK